MLSKRDTIALWFALHGPGFKAKGIKWQYDIDTDRYSFWREVECTGDALLNADSSTAMQIVEKLRG